jgi:hypothetical protein
VKPEKVQDGDTVGVSTKGRTIRKPSHLRDYVELYGILVDGRHEHTKGNIPVVP